MATTTGEPLRIGLIADIQYADREDGSDFSGLEKRYFRNALHIAEAAVECWNAFDVDMVVQLGDIIDGCNAQLGASDSALRTVLGVLEHSAASRRFDLIGNHELYNIQRDNLPMSGLNCVSPDGRTYHSVHLGTQWTGIFLDPYEHALIGVPKDHSGYNKAKEVLQVHNPQLFTEGTADWFNGLPVDKHRYVPFNGGVSVEQLDWLEAVLQAAGSEGRHVLVFTHVPLYTPATKPKTLVWNCEDVLSALHRHKEAVIAVFAGHDHDGGYAVDPSGLHHVTMNSALTAGPGADCFAILECYEGGWARFLAHGRACVESGTHGAGRAYPELVLAKGVENRPAGVAESALLTEAGETALQELVAMGFSQERAQLALDAAGGSVSVASGMLCGG
mmetsp:Transcript_71194/g.230454  ORF Transcript_71194/g.230454 Transcript_71194/m.230454 type:complete len:390 (-) Transcript_71194:149-1318(-)